MAFRLNRTECARLEGMVRAYPRLVASVLRRNGVREADVDDVAQHVFLTAARRLAAIREGAERPFLATIAVRAAGHARRAYRRAAWASVALDAEAPATDPLPDDVTESWRRRVCGRAALRGLPHDLGTLFVLFELEGCSIREIAMTLGLPHGTVKSRVRRARRQLTALLELDPDLAALERPG